MADLQIRLVKGTTSKLIQFQADSALGGLLTGLAFNTAGLKAYYYREGAGASVAITLVTMTLGTWTSGGFIVIDGTNMPGTYQLGVPDAALAAGAKSVLIELSGAANLNPIIIVIELEAVDNQDGVSYGLTSVKINSIIKKNTAQTNFVFVMLNTGGTPATGLTVTATRSIDGAAFGACANSVTEIANGFYKIDFAATDVNGTVIAFRFSATNARDTQLTVITNP